MPFQCAASFRSRESAFCKTVFGSTAIVDEERRALKLAVTLEIRDKVNKSAVDRGLGGSRGITADGRVDEAGVRDWVERGLRL